MDHPTPTVADVIRRDGDTYRDHMGPSLSMARRRVLTAIAQCRTAALGGHVEPCDRCGHTRIWYHSCRNRHGPTCQSLADPHGVADHLQPARQTEWVVYAKPPFAGPQQVLDSVGRYTHRVAIANHRRIDIDDRQGRFRYKNDRADPSGNVSV